IKYSYSQTENGVYVSTVPTNAGNYYVKAEVEGTDNYSSAQAKIPFTIEKRELVLEFKGTMNFVYDGNPHKEITVKATNIVIGDEVVLTVEYNGEVIERGEYKATAVMQENDNYIFPENNYVTVKISRGTHTVTFIQANEKDIVKTVDDLADLTDIPTPKPVSGYDVKWDRTDFTNITNDLTINAVLTEKTFTVTYVLNGGENNDSNPKEFTVNSADLTLYNPSKNGVGVAFGGWFTTSTFTDSTRITRIASGTSDNVTLYAKWLEYKIESAEGFTIDYDAEIPTLSIIVPNSKTQIELQNAFVVSEDCTWELYKTFTSDTPIKLKSLTLNAGDNVSYVVVWDPDETHFMRYELHIYRREIRAYSFMTGLDGKTVYTSGKIEEGTNLSAPAENPIITAYDFIEWQINGEKVNFPYLVPFGDNVVITAIWTPHVYSITYALNDGKLITDKNTYTVENNVTFDTPTRDYYDFVEWRIDGVKRTSTNGYHTDLTVTAIWTPHVYSITYALDGGKLTTSKNTYTVESNVTFDTPTKDGYEFTGWQINGVDVTGTNGYHDNLTVTATWGVVGYNITYVLNDNETYPASNTNSKKYNAENNVTFVNPSRTGYDFVEWQIDGVKKTSTNGYYSDITVTAIWTPHVYSITYDLKGGKLTTDKTTYTVESNAIFDTPTKDGYDFAEWRIDGVKKTSTEGFHDNLTATAIWTPHVYSITYVLGDGKLTTDKNTYTVENNVTFDTPTRDYYEFKEWQINGVKKTSTEGFHENLTVTAIWTPYVYSITYVLDGGKLTTSKNTYTVENHVTFDTPTKDWYDFIEWRIDGVKKTSTEGFHENLTVTAIWKPHVYNITYVLGNGGSLTTDKNTYTVENNITFDTPTRDYCEFKEWQIGGVKKTSTEGFHENLTVTAVWTNYTVFNITYNLNGGELTTDKNTYTIDDNVTFDKPTKNDYSFIEWQIDGVKVTSTEGFHENLTVTAVWEYGTEGLQYTLSNNKYSVSGYTGSATDVIIPSVHLGKPVTSINNGAFKNKSSLKSISIPDSVTSIGSGAFSGCSSLESMAIPFVGAKAGVTSSSTYQHSFGYIFGTSSYTGGTSTEQYYYGSSISYPTSVTYYIPTSLKSVTVTGGKILYGAFYGCKTLTSVTIPNSVTSIGSSAFYDCKSITSIVIPNSVTSIGERAFEYCSSLTSVTIPDSVTSIGDYAFYGCSLLTKVNYLGTADSWVQISFDVSSANPLCNGAKLYINDVLVTNAEITTVTKINDYAFYNCSSLTSVTIGNSVTAIGSSAFSNCSSLTSITIPNSVTSIDSGAFSGCSKLTSVTIPNSVKSIGGHAFSNCAKLTEIKYNAINCATLSSSNYVFSYAGKDGSGITVTIGKDVKKIPAYLFYGVKITKVILEEGSVCESIGSEAFRDCSSLASIEIPNSVTSIGGFAFDGCSSLTSITIPNSVTSIDFYAFRDCSSLTSIEIPNSVTSIGCEAFRNCSSLTSIVIPNSVTSIYSSAFEDCKSLTSVTIGNSVTSIGDYAFEYCSSLTSITIPNSVTSIGVGAFEYCYKLVEVWNKSGLSIGKGSTSNGYVGYYALNVYREEKDKKTFTDENGYIFYEDGDTCYLLGYTGNDTELILPSSCHGKNYKIYEYAFYDCTSLTSIEIPSSVTSIGSSAFWYCSSLTKVNYLGTADSWVQIDGLEKIMLSSRTLYFNNQPVTEVVITTATKINSYAFYNCSSLQSVTIGNSVTSIGECAFYCCDSLTSVTIGNSVTSIGASAFYNCTSLKYNEYDNGLYLGNCENPYLVLVYAKSKNITSCTIIDQCKVIYQRAFEDCKSLTSVTIGNSVTSIGSEAFSGCSSLTKVNYTGTIDSWVQISFGDSSANPLYYAKNLYINDVLITEAEITTATKINAYAFYNCSSLTSVTIGNSVTSIGGGAFYDCNSLKSIVIPDSVTSIGYSAFRYCSSLKSIVIPESVTSIGYSAFRGCGSLSSITIGSGVTSIADEAFEGCTALKSVTFNGTKSQWQAISKGSDWKHYVPSTCKVICTDGTVSI
ncbi:MAG: leucine-rich repeat protein, partial [Clostridia bacterium]|nr:leucine-rich repeat protein [Clostridia bacterium]